jgi:DNA-binding transcriptional MocR family regulator
MREVYAERLSTLLECAREQMAGLMEVSGLEAGLPTAAWLHKELDGESVAAAAAEHGVEVTCVEPLLPPPART